MAGRIRQNIMAGRIRQNTAKYSNATSTKKELLVVEYIDKGYIVTCALNTCDL
jgi:hypothetical protein